jgi:hypothetical protein
MMLYLSGDLDSGVLGPFTNHSQNDAVLLMDWLAAASTSAPNRGFWAIGDGFASSNVFSSTAPPYELMWNYLHTDVYHDRYAVYTGNTDVLARLRVLPEWQGKAPEQVLLLGVRNRCLWGNDVLSPYFQSTIATVSSEYDSRTAPGGSYIATAGVFKPWTASSPYLTQVEGWDIENLTHANDLHTVDRSGYFHTILENAWAGLCVVTGTPLVPLDVPADAGAIADFVRFGGANPVTSGSATIRFGMARTDRVEIRVYDVRGRLIRRLADRLFASGQHDVVWDGLDDAGRRVARGVYFTRVRYREARFETSRKLTLLR